MVEFVGLITVNILRGMNLAVRDMVTSDPVRRPVARKSNDEDEKFVYDKDKFSADDFIHPLLSAARASEDFVVREPRPHAESEDETGKGVVGLERDGRGWAKQEITVKLQNVERGEVDVELECMPLMQ
ncbi:hypothetical protein M569_15075 [Genlisea aurea]|uniref:Uncharacterized protein n=1 Tax=Genlisea aurea TaxID=192259 RepID=S8C5L8_9LAMI|nr:hypothetical protein M569_15075 [Genlisea aurea]